MLFFADLICETILSIQFKAAYKIIMRAKCFKLEANERCQVFPK